MRAARNTGWNCIFIIGLLTPLTGLCEFPGGIMVYAWDSSSGTIPPPATTANLNSTESQTFGTNDLVTFSGYFEAGMQTVEVSTEASGYQLRQSPTDPNAINDPYSNHGNPRYVEITESTNYVPVSFQFDPVVTVSAVVRDTWTMERLEDVSIEFIGRTGANAGVVYAEYPWGASYASNWMSDAEGNFPTNTILYLDNYDLTITKTGFLPYSELNAINNALAGDSINLGTIFLEPVDSNSNLIADAWETTFFGAGNNVDGSDDADGDGLPNLDEYLAGTDPTNALSCLEFSSFNLTNGFELTWQGSLDRTYRVSGTTHLSSNTWVQVAGPWECNDIENGMTWVETNTHLSWCSFYKLEVIPCWQIETNQILIRTNDWPTGGSGTNTWTGGPPPFPGG